MEKFVSKQYQCSLHRSSESVLIAEAYVTSDMGSSLWPEAPEVKFWLLHCPEQREQRGVLMFDMTFEEESLRLVYSIFLALARYHDM